MIREIIAHKSIIYELAIRDLKLRYRKPFLGFLWMLIIPFFTAFVYKVLFCDFMQTSGTSYPFFIHLITAMLPWVYFASSIQSATNSILNSKNIINQISFPKYLLPISTVLANLINFIPAILVLMGFIAAFKVNLGFSIFLLPPVILIHTCLIIGCALLVSCLQVIYRDVEYIIQILLTALFFLTPGVYTLDELINKTTPAFRQIYMLNPLVGILNLYRISFMGNYLQVMPRETNLLNTLVSPLLCSLAILLIGYFVFRKYEDRLFDYLNV